MKRLELVLYIIMICYAPTSAWAPPDTTIDNLYPACVSVDFIK